MKTKVKPFVLSLSLVVCVVGSTFAQHFSTPFIFESFNGKTDTIIMGYDSLATFGTNTIFGEVNEGKPDFSDTNHIGVYCFIRHCNRRCCCNVS